MLQYEDPNHTLKEQHVKIEEPHTYKWAYRYMYMHILSTLCLTGLMRTISCLVFYDSICLKLSSKQSLGVHSCFLIQKKKQN